MRLGATFQRLCVGPILAALSLQAATGTTRLLPGNVVEVAAGDFYLRAPDTIPAGITTFRIQVRQGAHIAVLVRLDSGHTATDLLNARRAGQPRPPWMHFIGGPGFPARGGSANATMELTPGQYLLFCDVQDRDGVYHFEKGMFHPLVVRAARRTTIRLQSMPRKDAVVTMRDYSFGFSAPLYAGTRVLRVENAGSVMHEFRVSRVLPGRTAREALAWTPKDKTPRPDEDVTALVGIMPGGSLTTTIAFEPGEYLVFCVPQIAHGMMQVFRVRPNGSRE